MGIFNITKQFFSLTNAVKNKDEPLQIRLSECVCVSKREIVPLPLSCILNANTNPPSSNNFVQLQRTLSP